MNNGDPSKQPPECGPQKLGSGYFRSCPNLKNTREGYDGEGYRCDVCGLSYFLDYEDMK